MTDTSSSAGGSALAKFLREPAGGNAEAIPVRSTVVGIGQGARNDIVLDDDTVSTNHAKLEYTAGDWRLTDLQSRNGTYVGGTRLAPGVPTILPEEATVRFGAVSLVFRREAGVNPEAAAAPQASTSGPTTVRRASFRLPVWLLVLVVLIFAVIAFLVTTVAAEPWPVVVSPPTILNPEHVNLDRVYA